MKDKKLREALIQLLIIDEFKIKGICDTFILGDIFKKTPAKISTMTTYFENRFMQFVPVRKYGKKVKIKKDEIGRMYGCSIIFNEEIKNAK